MRAFLKVSVLLGLAWSGLLWNRVAAQESPVPSTPEPAVTEDVASPNPQTRTIYLPFSDLNSAFENPETNVVLPYSEYKGLLESIRKASTASAAPAALISQAEYTVKLEGDLARITARLKVHVTRDGWSELPVSFGNATIGSVQVPEQVLLKAIGTGQNIVLFPKAGDFDVEFQLGARVQKFPDSRQIEFECPPVPQTQLEVTVPGEDQKIELTPPGTPKLEDEKPEEGQNEESTRLVAQLGATSKIKIQWRGAESQMPAMDLLTSVKNQTLVTVADGLIHTETWLNYSILRGEMDQTRIVLPKSARLLDVFSEQGIANWTTATQDENQIVTVKFPKPVKEKLQITVRTETKLEDSEFTVAGISADKVAFGIHALDAVRENGQIAVRSSADLNVSVVSQQGLIRIEQGETDPKLVGANTLSFKYYAPQISLRLSAKPVEPRIIVRNLANLTFSDDELDIKNQLAYQIEQAGLFEVVLKIPEGVAIDQVLCDQLKEFNFDSNSRLLTISLRERTLGALNLVVQSHLDLPNDPSAQLQLPLLEPVKADREQGEVRVFSKNSLEIQAVQDGIESAQPIPYAGSANSGEAVHLAAAWSYFRRPVVIPVKVLRKPTRLRAFEGTTINIEPEVVHVTSRIEFVVEYAAIGEFRIEVPEAISSKLQIEVEPGHSSSAPIKQKNASEAANGKVVWTIQTQRDVLGSQVFLIKYDLPVPAAAGNETTKEREFRFEFLRPLGNVAEAGNPATPLVEFRGEVAVTRDRTLALSAISSGNGIEQVDPRELKLLPQDGALAFRYFRDDQDNPVGLTVKSSRFEIQHVVDTVVTRGLVEIVTSEDQASTYRCRFRVRSSERQRLLIGLPGELEVLGAFLNDREVKLEKAETALPKGMPASLTPFWINVSRPESSEQSFLLTFQFLWNLPETTRAQFREDRLLALPLPVLAGGANGVVQELKVVIWVPEEYALIGDPEPFVLQKRSRPMDFLIGKPANHDVASLTDWVTEGEPVAAGFTELPTEGRSPFVFTTLGSANELTVRVWNKLWMTILISGTLVLIGWILSATSWENKLGILLLFAFLASLYGMYDSHGLAQGVHAARAGLVVMLGWWLLRGIFHVLRPSPKVPLRTDLSSPVPYAVIPPPGVFDHLKPEAGN